MHAFCICTCSVQLSMFHMERRSRNMLIIMMLRPFFSNGLCGEIHRLERPKTADRQSNIGVLLFSFEPPSLSQSANFMKECLIMFPTQHGRTHNCSGIGTTHEEKSRGDNSPGASYLCLMPSQLVQSPQGHTIVWIKKRTWV